MLDSDTSNDDILAHLDSLTVGGAEESSSNDENEVLEIENPFIMYKQEKCKKDSTKFPKKHSSEERQKKINSNVKELNTDIDFIRNQILHGGESSCGSDSITSCSSQSSSIESIKNQFNYNTKSIPNRRDSYNFDDLSTNSENFPLDEDLRKYLDEASFDSIDIISSPKTSPLHKKKVTKIKASEFKVDHIPKSTNLDYSDSLPSEYDSRDSEIESKSRGTRLNKKQKVTISDDNRECKDVINMENDNPLTSAIKNYNSKETPTTHTNNEEYNNLLNVNNCLNEKASYNSNFSQNIINGVMTICGTQCISENYSKNHHRDQRMKLVDNLNNLIESHYLSTSQIRTDLLKTRSDTYEVKAIIEYYKSCNNFINQFNIVVENNLNSLQKNTITEDAQFSNENFSIDTTDNSSDKDFDSSTDSNSTTYTSDDPSEPTRNVHSENKMKERLSTVKETTAEKNFRKSCVVILNKVVQYPKLNPLISIANKLGDSTLGTCLADLRTLVKRQGPWVYSCWPELAMELLKNTSLRSHHQLSASVASFSTALAVDSNNGIIFSCLLFIIDEIQSHHLISQNLIASLTYLGFLYLSKGITGELLLYIVNEYVVKLKSEALFAEGILRMIQIAGSQLKNDEPTAMEGFVATLKSRLESSEIRSARYVLMEINDIYDNKSDSPLVKRVANILLFPKICSTDKNTNIPVLTVFEFNKYSNMISDKKIHDSISFSSADVSHHEPPKDEDSDINIQATNTSQNIKQNHVDASLIAYFQLDNEHKRNLFIAMQQNKCSASLARKCIEICLAKKLFIHCWIICTKIAIADSNQTKWSIDLLSEMERRLPKCIYKLSGSAIQAIREICKEGENDTFVISPDIKFNSSNMAISIYNLTLFLIQAISRNIFDICKLKLLPGVSAGINTFVTIYAEDKLVLQGRTVSNWTSLIMMILVNYYNTSYITPFYVWLETIVSKEKLDFVLRNLNKK